MLSINTPPDQAAARAARGSSPATRQLPSQRRRSRSPIHEPARNIWLPLQLADRLLATGRPHGARESDPAVACARNFSVKPRGWDGELRGLP